MSNGLTLPFEGTLDDDSICISVTSTGGGDGLQGVSSGFDRDGLPGIGVNGRSDAGTGVQGESGQGFAVYGSSTNGIGVVGESQRTDGIVGRSPSAQHSGVWGDNTGSGFGVSGSSVSGHGVHGHSTREGVHGHGDQQGTGVVGDSDFGIGIEGVGNPGVKGQSDNFNGAGVVGIGNVGWSPGVIGQGFLGVRGDQTVEFGPDGTSTGVGVYGNQFISKGILGSGSAGWFAGDVYITRNLKVVGDFSNFTIDHPLDPANKYLNHRYVESPERKNIYDGTVVLNAEGEAKVNLPAWFGALNSDFRYQLTCIGGFAPVYISQTIKDGSFQIAGGQPGMQVSWQVTGIRRDPWALQNPVIVEEDKSERERGYYLNAEAYGQPQEKSINWLLNPLRGSGGHGGSAPANEESQT